MHIITQASAPNNLKIDVMVECKDIGDVTFEDDVDQHLKGLVRLIHVKDKGVRCPILKLKRLTKRCVEGDETLVVYMDDRVRLVRGWDAMLMQLYAESLPRMVLSAPGASKTGIPKFPTRTKNVDGVFRGLDRKFESRNLQIDVVPSVCVCTEFCVFKPDVLREIRAWPSSPVAFTESLRRSECVVTAPTVVLVEGDKRLYSDVVSCDAGCKDVELHKAQRVGLTDEAEDVEKIVKFGSCRAAKLTLQFL